MVAAPQKPEMGALDAFIELVSCAQHHEAPPIGNLVKDCFRDKLSARYHLEKPENEKDVNSVPALWHRFFSEIRQLFPSVIKRRYTDAGKNDSLENLYADIVTNVLGKWLPEDTKAHGRLAYACYLSAHTYCDGDFTGVARNIDAKFLGKPFEEVFNAPMPLTVIGAEALLRKFKEREIEREKHFVRNNLAQNYSEKERIDTKSAVHKTSLNTKIPYSSKHGLRFSIIDHLPDIKLDAFFSEVASENILFQANDDLDVFLTSLAEIVGARCATAPAQKAFLDRRDAFLEGRAAIKNFLGLDRPILSEFSQGTELDSPLKKRHSYQRLAAAGVNLGDLGRMGEMLLRKVSELELSDASNSFVVRATLKCKTVSDANEIAANLRARIPLRIAHLFEFVAVVRDASELSEHDDQGMPVPSGLHHLAVHSFLEHAGDQFSDDLEVVRERARQFFSRPSDTVGVTSSTEFFKYLDAQKMLQHPPKWTDYQTVLSSNSTFRERFARFVQSCEFQFLDSIIIQYSRTDKPERDFISSALESIYKERHELDLLVLSKIRIRIDLLEGFLRNDVPSGAAVSFLSNFLEKSSSFDNKATSQALYLISYYYFRGGRYYEAKIYCHQSLEKDPKNYAARCFWGLMQLQDGNNNEALESFNLARQDSGNTYEFAHFYEAIAFEEAGNKEDAKEAYVRALLLRPNFYEVAHNLCNLLIAEGRILDASRLAAAQITKYAALTSEFASALAFGLVASGHSKEARDLLLRIPEGARAPIVQYNIAVLFFNRRQATMCMGSLDTLRANPMCPKFILDNAIELEKRIIEKDFPPIDEDTLINAQLADTIDPMLGVLFDKHYAGDLFSQNHLVQLTQQALRRTPRPPTRYMPKSERRMEEAKLSQEELEAKKERRQSYAAALRRGRGGLEPKSVGRRRRNESQKSGRGFASLLLAPSYSGG